MHLVEHAHPGGAEEVVRDHDVDDAGRVAGLRRRCPRRAAAPGAAGCPSPPAGRPPSRPAASGGRRPAAPTRASGSRSRRPRRCRAAPRARTPAAPTAAPTTARSLSSTWSRTSSSDVGCGVRSATTMSRTWRRATSGHARRGHGDDVRREVVQAVGLAVAAEAARTVGRGLAAVLGERRSDEGGQPGRLVDAEHGQARVRTAALGRQQRARASGAPAPTAAEQSHPASLVRSGPDPASCQIVRRRVRCFVPDQGWITWSRRASGTALTRRPSRSGTSSTQRVYARAA